MKHRDDFHPILMRTVKHAVGKPAHHCLANIHEYYLVHQRVNRDVVKYCLDLANKLASESDSLRSVPIERPIKPRLGLVSEDDRQGHCRALARARALMISQGVTASGRAMLSAKRRS